MPSKAEGAFVPRPLLLGVLDFLPVRPDFVHALDFGLPKDMRMPAHELFHDQPADLFEIKRAAFARQLAVEDDLQQQIAEFLGHFVVVLRLDGVNQFIDLLDGVAPQASCDFARGPTDSPWASAAGP